MNNKFSIRPVLLCFLTLFLCAPPGARAFQKPAREPLPNIDARANGTDAPAASPIQRQAADQLKTRAPGASVDFDRVTGAARFVSASGGFLTGPDGEGGSVSKAAAGVAKDDPHRATKVFLMGHRALFGHGPEVLNEARVKREFTAAHNGLKTVVWEQQVEGVPIFEAVLISHTTKRGELVNISSQFVPEPVAAADRGTPGRAALRAAPTITAAQALARAAANLGEATADGTPRAIGAAEATPEQRQKLTAPFLRGEGEAKLIWLPMGKDTLRLCWDVLLTVRQRGEMYRVLVDVQNGDVLLRRCLTDYLTNATYRVFTSDSPSPFSPGHPTPLTNQPPLLARSLVTLPALDTNASPAGWINDGGNETLGNNVDAHTDLNDDDVADLPRPAGSPFRVFDFPLDLTTQAPSAYRSAAVVQLFYWCNWMHDKLYALGFTEAAGNFQSSNFGRGGLGNDALQADAQDGGGTDNANMSTPSDGSAPRMQMYVFSGPALDRDGDFDAEIVLHEYTHGLSNRRVGGGVGLSALQSGGMGEGWSDWYGLTLLSEASDNVNGNYAAGGYATYQLSPSFQQNYYYGIRRYPYSTDLAKNPLTFKDIDPAQAGAHAGIPKSPVVGGGGADEVHNQGEVWCVTLWEARANLINKHGFATGNQLILQLVTDGLNLSPANPNFLQARDAIIQADLVLTGGANRNDLWAAFAKRGMGMNGTSPASYTTSGVHESFEVPDDLLILPAGGFTARGPVGGPFDGGSKLYTLTNGGAAPLNWSLVNTSAWLNASALGGSLSPGGPSADVIVALTAAANNLTQGVYSTTVVFSNTTSGVAQGRTVTVRAGMSDYFTELFDTTANDLAFSAITFTPDGSPGYYRACRGTMTNFFTDPAGGTNLFLGNHVTRDIVLGSSNQISIYGLATNRFFLSSDGHLTLNFADSSGSATFANHFALPRVSALFSHLHPGDGGRVMYQELVDRMAITFETIPNYNDGLLNSFQIELFFDGRIRLCYLALGSPGGLVGLSAGQGQPAQFEASDFSSYASCLPPLLVTVPASATEGAGVLAGQGLVRLPLAVATNVTVSLASGDTNEVTVPASIVVPAGQTNATFDLTIVDDARLDGTQTASISATAPGFDSGSASLAVHDNETAAIFVSLPATATEGGGSVTGLVWISAAPAASVRVNLASSDVTELQVPPYVSIPAGQTSVVFFANVVDDTLIDGPQPVTVTAQVQNWTPGSALLTVLDNESLNLSVTLPASALESAGTLANAGTVLLSGTLLTNLTVSLFSSDLTATTVPASILIPAGQFSVSFNLTVVDDLVVDGNQLLTVTASAPGFADGFATMTVLDDETPPVPSSPAPADLATNVSASTDLAWDNGRLGITNDVYFGTNPTPGAPEFLGRTTGSTWDLPLLAPNTVYYWQIVARKLGVTPSPVWRFTTRGVNHFELSALPSPQLVNQPFGVTLTARDELNRAVTNFTGPVALSAWNGGGPGTVIEDFESGAWPHAPWSLDGGGLLGTSYAHDGNYGLSGPEWTFRTDVQLGNSDESLSWWIRPSISTLGRAYLGFGASPSGCWSIVAAPNTGAFILQRNDFYGFADVVTVSQTWVENHWYKVVVEFQSTSGVIGKLYDSDGTTLLNSLSYSDVTGLPGGVAIRSFDSLSLDTLTSGSGGAQLAITPTNSGDFSNGTWSGNITFQTSATNAVLLAEDPAGHKGFSNPFHVVFSNQPPLLLTQPASLNVFTGATVQLKVSAFGVPPFSYQWRFNGDDLTGETNATLTLTGVSTNRSGLYSVVVMNPFGTVASSNALLTVLLPPIVFANPGQITIPDSGPAAPYPSTITVSGVTNLITNLKVTLYEMSHTYASDIGVLLVGPNGQTVVLMNAAGDDTELDDTTLVFDDGAPTFLPEYARILSGTYKPTDYYTNGVFDPPAPARPYSPALSVFNGTDPNGVWKLFVMDFAAEDDGDIAGGWSISLSTDGAIPSGSHLTWSTIPSPQFTNAPFAVTIEARDSAGQIITDFPGPVALLDATTGSVVSNSILPSPTHTGSIPEDGTFGYSFTPSTNLTVLAIRHYFGTKVSIWTDAGVLLATQSVASVPGTWVETPLATPLQLTAGTRYRVASYTGGGINYVANGLATNFPNGTIDQSYHVSGDAFPTTSDGLRWWFVDLRYVVPARPVSITPTNSGAFTNGIWSGLVRVLNPATNLVLLADDGTGLHGASSPFHVVRSNQPPVILAAPANQTVRAGSNVIFSAEVYGAPIFTYQWRRNGTNLPSGGRISGATGSVLTISNIVVSDAALYSVFVVNTFGNALSAGGALTVNPVDHFSWSFIASPASTLLPFAVSIQARDFLNNIATGFTGTVAVSAALAGSGTPVLVSPAVSGAFVAGVWNGSLSIPQVAANVVLRAQDGLGDFGLSAPFDVGQLVAFTQQPTNQNVLPGTNVTLAAAAVGTGPVRYQWRFEGTNISGATNSTFSFLNANLNNGHGNFSVVASDDLSTAFSSNAFIFVLIRPGIILQPLPQEVVQGGNALFVCVATGAPPLFYRWITNGLGLATNTGGVFVFSNAQGNFSVRVNVRNNAGNVNSSTVALTVLRDFDGDGMADIWETNYFGFSTNNAADGLLDFDGDGMSNRDEYLAGTNPTNALSVLRIFQSGPDGETIAFVAQTNKTYSLLCRTNLSDAPWKVVTNIFPSTSVRTIQVNSALSPPLPVDRYYRVTTPLLEP